MNIVVIRCGEVASSLPSVPVGVSYDVPPVPQRRDLAFIDELAREFLPVDDTPSLDEMMASSSIQHLGDPAADPRSPREPVRLVVVGSDAALAAVVTRVMRADATWMEVAFVPTDPSSSAVVSSWGLDVSQLWVTALSAVARPMPLIRDDVGFAVVGSAEIRTDDAGSLASVFEGEILVDGTSVVLCDGPEVTTAPGDSSLVAAGVRLVPTCDAPGIAAATLFGVPRLRRFPWSKRRDDVSIVVDTDHVRRGRAVQAGGPALRIIREGVPHPRVVERATFYRHLRDLQAVRP